MSCSQGLPMGGLRRMLIGPSLICKSLGGRKAQPSPILMWDRVWYPSPWAHQSLHLEIRIDKQHTSFLGNDVWLMGTGIIWGCAGLWAKHGVLQAPALNFFEQEKMGVGAPWGAAPPSWREHSVWQLLLQLILYKASFSQKELIYMNNSARETGRRFAPIHKDEVWAFPSLIW